MSSLPNQDFLEAQDRAHLLHPSTHLKNHASGQSENRIFERGEGIYVYTKDGREIIDGFAGLYCSNLGYGQKEIVDAIKRQADTLAYYPAYGGCSSEPAIQLAERIISLAPPGMSRVYFGLSGSDANETAVKIAWYYNDVQDRPEKKKIISRERAYHGSSIVTGSLTGLSYYHHGFDLPLDRFLHTRCPHYFHEKKEGESETDFSRRCAAELDAMIQAEGPETVAAFIAEPVMGTGGIIPPPAGYWQAIKPVLDKYDILFIADEVVTGFGRLGSWFGSNHFDIRPDIMSMAKGLTSAYLPLSATAVNERVWDVLVAGSDKYGAFGHGWTYSAHPVCVAAGLANLDLLERLEILPHVQTTGAYLDRSLKAAFLDHPLVGEVRGIGMLGAVEFVRDRELKQPFDPVGSFCARVTDICWRLGLIVRPMPKSDTIGLAPPLITTTAEIDAMVSILETAVNEASASVE